MRKLFLFFVVLALMPLAHAQYSWSPSLSFVDNTYWCATHNCLTNLGGVVLETKAGFDGTVYGLNGAHVLYSYTHASGWVQLPSALQTAGGHPITHISVASEDQVLALTDATYPNDNVYVLNVAENAWQDVTGWLSTAEISIDGNIWGMNGSQIFYWTGGVWYTETGWLSNIAVGNTAYGVDGNHKFWSWYGPGWSNISLPFTPSSALNAITAQGQFVGLIDTSNGIHVSQDGGNTWSTIKGSAVNIAGGGTYTFVKNASGVSFHLNLLVPHLINNGSGQYQGCPANGCPQGSFHTMTSHIVFGGIGGAHGTVGVTATYGNNPNAYLIAKAEEDGVNCDPVYSDPSAPECNGSYDGEVRCSVMGVISLLGVTSAIPNFEFAYTRVAYTGGPRIGCRPLGGGQKCDYPVQNWCTADTSPPDNDYTGAYVGDLALFSYWETDNPCFRFGNSGPWSCFKGLAVGRNSDLPFASCTKTY